MRTKTNPTRTLARTAISAGAAAAAILAAGAATTTGSLASLDASSNHATVVAAPADPTADAPCFGNRLDQYIGPLIGSECGGGEGGGPGDDPSDGTPPMGGGDDGGNPPPPGA